ncbi:hypothetical protein B0H10DRAFT_368320 [Mycena sp. CBHHK59/15]|nr:hypothetical protein B0H10DRAFT_368320 [Mycena sp. CBHHK59/15]
MPVIPLLKLLDEACNALIIIQQEVNGCCPGPNLRENGSADPHPAHSKHPNCDRVGALKEYIYWSLESCHPVALPDPSSDFSPSRAGHRLTFSFALDYFCVFSTMHFFSIVATALISTAIAARGSPLPPSTLHQRAAVKFHILTGGEEACDPTQVAAIKAGITDAKAMANVALTTLKGKDMNKSNGFFWLFGGSSVSATEIADRFQFVNNLGTPDEVTSLDAFENSQQDVVFTCIPASNPKAGAAYANTVNIGKLTKSSNGVVPTVNLMRFGTFGLKVCSYSPTHHSL